MFDADGVLLRVGVGCPVADSLGVEDDHVGVHAFPQQASILNAVLGGDGSVTINFQGNGPIGTVWQVSRKLPSETGFSFIGNADASTKSFTDATVPAGIVSADYQVQGIRGSVTGPVSFGFNVKFGGADGVAAPASAAA